MVLRRHLVEHFRIILEGLKAVGETFRNVERLAVFRRQFHAEPSLERHTRSFPDCVTRFDMKKRVLANYFADLVDSRMVGYDDAFRLCRDAFYTMPKALFHV